MCAQENITYNFFQTDRKKVLETLGKEKLIEALRKMLLIRNFEVRAESAYQMGKVGGFFHSYIGQEAIQTSCTMALGDKHYYTTTYRCHALALLLGVTPDEVMAELYGKVTGNAKGRGGSMHLYSDRLLGGFGIVGGHVPVATGAGFTLKYKNLNDLISLCFMGDGAVVQGAVHESLNLASLWNLPCLYVIENNQWGMGTAVSRAVCHQPIAENLAKGYGIKGYTIDGMDYLTCYDAFSSFYKEILETKKPILVEALTERFKGHSISDPGLYRSKETLEEAKKKDPIIRFKHDLLENNIITEDEFKEMDKELRNIAVKSMEYAENSPDPDPITLEDDVFAP